MLRDRLIRGSAVVSPIGDDFRDFTVDLPEQRRDLRRIIDVLFRERMRHDQAADGIHRQMQLAPAPT